LKRLILFLLIIIPLFSLYTQVNGELLIIDGKNVLKVWGSHYDRGYAHGYLMGDQIREIAVDYFIGAFLLYNPITYEYCRDYFDIHFSIEQKYLTEAQGMIDGMTDAEVNMYITELDKDIEAVDVLMANSLVDLYNLYFINSSLEFGCSSLSAWGESTLDDPLLNGNLLITRNMDWSASQILVNNHLLIVNIPTEENEISWVSFSFAGMIGVLSGINSNGTAAFMNVGNIHNTEDDLNLHPIFLSVRNGLEHYDYNQDGEQNEQDIVSSISDKNHATGSIVHAVHDPDAIIIETNNHMGSITRSDTDNTVIPTSNLVATNHFRALYDPSYCYRYNNFADSLNYSIEQDVFRNWNITTGAGGVYSSLHTIQYVPSQDIIKWSTATAYDPSYLLEPTVFDLSELFTINTSSENDTLNEQVLVVTGPNPFKSGMEFSFTLPQLGNVELSIYNIKGQKIRNLLEGDFISGRNKISWDGRDDEGQSVVSGVYFYKLKLNDTYNTGRLIILK
jgi:flagellar hook capping protein FlgD